MKIDLSKMICEILSGLFLIFLIVLIIFYFNSEEISDIFIKYAATKIDISKVSIFFAICYLLGIILDSIGLLFDEFVIDKFVDKNIFWFEKTTSTKKLSELDEHTLSYRSAQWSYYTCYRNLLILIIPIEVFLSLLLLRNNDWMWLILSFLLFSLVSISFVYSMGKLLKIYHGIAETV